MVMINFQPSAFSFQTFKPSTFTYNLQLTTFNFLASLATCNFQSYLSYSPFVSSQKGNHVAIFCFSIAFSTFLFHISYHTHSSKYFFKLYAFILLTSTLCCRVNCKINNSNEVIRNRPEDWPIK